MKKISALISIVFLFGLNSTYAQKCKVSKDPFSNETLASFDYEGRTLYYEYKNKVLKMEILCNYEGELNVMVPKGAELLFKLENGEILKLATAVETAPKTQFVPSSGRVLTQYSYVMELNKDNLDKLVATKVTLIRYPDTKGGSLDIDLSRFKKFGAAIQKGAECMKTNL